MVLSDVVRFFGTKLLKIPTNTESTCRDYLFCNLIKIGDFYNTTIGFIRSLGLFFISIRAFCTSSKEWNL